MIGTESVRPHPWYADGMVPPEPVPQQVRSPVAAGQVVDRKYRIDGVLGAGGMGIVVSATHLALDEPVALKFMTLDEGRGDSTSRARFLREAKAARKLTSAHVARVFDVGQLPSGEPYIVMEFLRGDDLAKHLRANGRFSAADTVRYMLQVCDAIREAHALGIVHRDLKPQNLFLTERPGGTKVIKVLDFGIAKSLEVGERDISLTTSQNVVGSPVYMSPEQLRASKHVDERTDIWSIGVIMFELLSGKVPFMGDSVLELGMRIMTVPAPSLVELRAELPSELADVVQKCLEKEPEKRFASIDALVTSLRPFVDVSRRSLPFADTAAAPSSMPPSSAFDQLRTGGEFAGTKDGPSKRGARNVRAWLGVGAGVVGVAIVAALVLHGGTGATDPATAADSAPTTFHAGVNVNPPNATVRFDSEGALPAPFSRDLPRDGKSHTLIAEATGFEPVVLSFRDVPPPAQITLKQLWQPAAQPTPSAVPAIVPSALPIASVVNSPPHADPRPHTTSRPPSTAPNVTSAPPPIPTSTTPKTTNDSPIVR